MANSGITRNVDTIISTLNKKADTNLANSAKAGEIEDIAKSAASAAQSAATVAHAASELINTALPQKVNKNGDTFNGSVVVDGDLTVTGEINATITGSSESAMSATKDSSGNVIVDTYATKAQLNTTNTNVATNATNITTAQNRADSAYTLADSKVSSNNGTMTFPLDDYSVDFRRAGDEGNYTVSLVTNKTLDNSKVYNTVIDKNGKFLPEFIKGLSVSGKTITYTKGDGSTGTITTQDTNTTYSAFTKATSSAAGKAGLVPAPAAGAQAKFLRGDATWQTIASVNTKAYITETWSSGASWYRKWSNGWIEQGGQVSPSAEDTTWTFHKAFKNTNYFLEASQYRNSESSYATNVERVSTTQWILHCDTETAHGWYACGY